MQPKRLTFGSLFAGIGGFDLGFERAGMECKWQVEIDPKARDVLTRHWPMVRRHDDVRTFPPAGEWGVDVVCGGFPCQDISNAGKKAGIDGERSGLWSQYARIIRVVRPRFVVVENVAALLERGMGRVLRDLAAGGFDAEWDVLPASAFGAPHERERLFLVAFSREIAFRGSIFPNKQHDFPRNEQWSSAEDIKDGQISSGDFCGMDDGLSEELDRVGLTGNAVVPAIAEWIGGRIVSICA